MTLKNTAPEKRQTDDEVILQALEAGNKMLKELYDYCIKQRRNALEGKPLKFLGLDDCDDIMLTGYEVEGAIDLFKARMTKAASKKTPKKAAA